MKLCSSGLGNAWHHLSQPEQLWAFRLKRKTFLYGKKRSDNDSFHKVMHETITTVLATWKQQGQNPTETLPKTITLKWQNS
jgi:hypothetical protein